MKMGKGERRPDLDFYTKENKLRESTEERNLEVEITPKISPKNHNRRVMGGAHCILENVKTAFKHTHKEVFRKASETYVRTQQEYT